MLDEFTPQLSEPQYRGSFQQLADARRVLKTNSLKTAPVLPAEERLELERMRALAIRTIEAATEELLETLDALHDPDQEPNDNELDGSRAEDEEGVELYAGGPGCPVSDPPEDAKPESAKQREYKRSMPHEDREDHDPREDDDPDTEHDGCEHEDGV